MMTILTRFVAKEWFKSFLTAAISLFIIMSVADLITGFLRSNVTAIEILYNYVFNIPEFFSRTVPVACLMGTLFSINKLKSHSELIAILAAGYSAQKIIGLITFCSLLITLFQFLILAEINPKSKNWRHQYMPESMKSKFSASKEKGLKTSSLATGLIWYKSSDYFVSFSAYNKKTSEIINPTVFYFDQTYKGKHIIKAPLMHYIGENQWKFFNGIEITELMDKTYPKFFNFDSKVVSLHEKASDFDQIESDIETLNFKELNSFVNHIKESGINIKDYEVMLYEMLSMSLICLVFALFPTDSIFNPNRRNSSFGKNVIFTLVFTIGYYVIYSGSVTLGTKGLIPVWSAVFLVPFLSIFYCLFVILKNRKL
jgi:lipopolysaccharide export system permease protein